ncbi:flagellar basal body rod modification protein [Pseudoduganella sp. LjRoot289]|uniref:flagellar hook capping FlgD N-terminal domain-containing protein n=1 Tax=Pseudoduganella sp. LjRoot289 TaxID=3342314 RepID=UPI003ECE8BB1
MQTNFFPGTTPAAATTGSSNPLASGSETSTMFTKLLVAQIQNQDPLSPSDPSQFINQLTQLSQTEALQNVGNLTSANASILQSMQVLALGAQVGSDVQVSAEKVQLDVAKVHGEINLSSNSNQTTLVLTGLDGREHKVELGSQSSGAVPFALDPSALGLPTGEYKMRVETSSKENPAIDLKGRLNSVRLGSGGAVVLNVSNVGETSPAAITAFNGKAAAASSSTSN